MSSGLKNRCQAHPCDFRSRRRDASCAYHDTRKFRTMELMELNGDLRHFPELGPEPFDDEFNPDYCRAFLKKRRVPIKQVLLDQSFVAGIGNIYANEICFALRIDPRKRCDQLTKAQITALPEITRQILSLAIEAGAARSATIPHP